MRLNTLEKLYECLKNESPEITVDPEVAEKAVKPIQRMLEDFGKVGIIRNYFGLLTGYL